ncbi:MAG: hypothetical protein D3926_15575 [Desulfobacteraceae bacterium]|nr:MAG: hypothetical protein D3926_15575 [Desulfobacteraceae bacterium]
MENILLEKNMIFYNPGHKGTVFTLAANTYINQAMLDETIDHLEFETENPIEYVQERRAKPRPIEI